jgi:hypothetical protein
MNIGSYWARLLHELRRVGTVKEDDGVLMVYPDRPGRGPREVVIVMNPDEWDDMASVAWGGDVDAAARRVGQMVRELGPEHGFLVYVTYSLVQSDAPELPPSPGLEAFESYFDEHPEDRGKGGWYAHPPESVDPKK